MASKKLPFRLPPTSTRAPRATASWTHESMRDASPAEMSGPMYVLCGSGVMARVRARACARQVVRETHRLVRVAGLQRSHAWDELVHELAIDRRVYEHCARARQTKAISVRPQEVSEDVARTALEVDAALARLVEAADDTLRRCRLVSTRTPAKRTRSTASAMFAPSSTMQAALPPGDGGCPSNTRRLTDTAARAWYRARAPPSSCRRAP